jgi:DNA mismatch repair protein MutL
LEIRFLNQSKLFSILQKSAQASLEKNVLMPSIVTESIKSDALDRSNKRLKSYNDEQIINKAIDFTKNFVAHDKVSLYGNHDTSIFTDDSSISLDIKPLAQIGRSYILAENKDGLILIDQHAAHERIKYEELMDQYESSRPAKQQLLMPLNIELSRNEAEIFKNNESIFKKLGFEIEIFGGDTFIIHAIPSPISKENIENILLNVINDIAENKKTHAIKNPQEKIIEYMACRSAIKFGKALTLEEMIALINDLNKLKRPYTCPHGRPSMIKITFNELEKMFKRR